RSRRGPLAGVHVAPAPDARAGDPAPAPQARAGGSEGHDPAGARRRDPDERPADPLSALRLGAAGRRPLDVHLPPSLEHVRDGRRRPRLRPLVAGDAVPALPRVVGPPRLVRDRERPVLIGCTLSSSCTSNSSISAAWPTPPTSSARTARPP